MTVYTWTMTQKLILWVLILNASLKPSESHGPEFEEGEHYEVVRPVRLHTVRKRHAEQYHRPDTLTYAMTVGGQYIEMQLQRNNELLTKDYSETHYQEDGTRVTTAPNDIDHCYYHGRIVNDSESSVSISTCDGLRGYFRTSAQRYVIEPLSSDDEGDHAVRTFNEKNVTPAVCGVTNTSWSDDFEPPTGLSRSRSAGISIVQQQKYIELVLVADHREYVKMNRDQTKLRERIFEIVNFVNMVYKPLRTFIALVGLEIWSSRDLISVTPSSGANLDAFMAWRNSELVKRVKHDNAHLISGIDFEGSVIGLAFVGTLCSGHSVGIVQDHTDQAIAVGATLAHEMGHNLGMNHDDSSRCFCSGESCIMSAFLSWKTPQNFSSCSTNYYENLQTTRSPTCLLDKPNYKNIVAPAVCGNGFREEGEQCDCGSVKECTNLCCNATTCTLKEGSQCAEGECCENCKISPTTRVCRGKQDDCDLAEYCDGKSTTCPEDVFAVNGLQCDGGLGYCYNGQCPQRSKQCVKMYGSDATEASQSCYNYNTRGTYNAFCKRPSNDQYIPCQQEDVLCGKLFCNSNNDDPNYGVKISIGNCKTMFFHDYTQDYSLVEMGTKCGDGKVCSQSQCVALQTAYRNTNCSAKCPGHAVCNHKSECQCEPGWKLPYCDTMDEAFSDTGKTVAIVVAGTLLLLGIIAAIAGIIWKKRQSPTLPTAATQRKQMAVENPAYHLNKQPAPSYHGPVRQADRLKPEGPPPPPAGNKPKPGIQIYRAAPPPPAIQNYRVAPPPPAIQNYRVAPPPQANQNYRVAPPPQANQNNRVAPPPPAIQNYRVAPPPQANQNYSVAPPPPGNKPKISIPNYAAARQALRPVPPPKV